MLKLIPEPNNIKIDDTKTFLFSNDIQFENIGYLFLGDFEIFVSKLNFLKNDSITKIHFAINAKLRNEEYSIKVALDRISLVGGSNAGLFYGLQTLKQIILQTKGELPLVEISDFPKYEYRGFMLDVGRYFYKVEEIKRYIDLMALHKLNIFHWHLTEDQGWRIEIKKYPLLTDVGSKRSHTNFGCKPHKGFYTQKEIKEVIDYCHKRYIKVIPEFDIPGHMVSAIASYPYLGCFDRKIKVATHWGVKHDIICAGKESTYEFVYDVIDEMTKLFTDGYFHMGGDEAVKTRWRICPHCQKAIKENKLSNEEDLQQFFMSKINRYLKKKNIISMMWNWDAVEHAKHLDKDIVWQFCGTSNEEVTVKEINSGRRIVNASAFPYYLDFPYGWNSLKQTYDYNPIISGVSKDNMDTIMGVEAPLWTEYVPQTRKADYCTFPRLAAVADTAWSNSEKDYDKFLMKIKDYYRLLDIYEVKYASLKQANPNFLRGKLYSLWFNRRMLHWQGLHNLIDNFIVKRKYKNK